MGRIAATVALGLLLVLDIALPWTPIGRRGREAAERLDEPRAVGRVGETLPDLSFVDFEGREVKLSDFRGYPTVITFERSVDW
jgi:cytochrome oxidase Cu insertion factor (SCO1/SenC/PrrC family)